MKAYLAGLALGALAVSPALVGSASAAVATGPKHLHRVFDIMRAGSRIGTDTFDIARQGDTTTVKIDTQIVVKIAFITAYRYTHSETESWKGNQLVAFSSTTDDNGKNHEVSATQTGGKLAMVVDGVDSTAPKTTMPASLWSADVSKGSQLFDPANGKRMAVQVQDLGPEEVRMNGAPQQLDHVKLSGAFPRDLWFDNQGLVKMTLLGSDNSEVTSQLRQSTAAR